MTTHVDAPTRRAPVHSDFTPADQTDPSDCGSQHVAQADVAGAVHAMTTLQVGLAVWHRRRRHRGGTASAGQAETQPL